MKRIVICGGPRTGKTTLANRLADEAGDPTSIMVGHADDLIPLGWSEASQRIADEWLTHPGPWILEGVAMVRALRKWRESHPGEPPPCDEVRRLEYRFVDLTPGQIAMTKGERTVWNEIEEWITASVAVTVLATVSVGVGDLT